MSYVLAIKSLYAANGLFAVLLYVPQIINVWRDRSNAVSVSLLTFGGWTVGSVITALYASTFVKDQMFTAVSVGNLVGCGTVFCIVAGKRFMSRKDGGGEGG